MTVDEALNYASWIDPPEADSADDMAIVALSAEVLRLREENARLNDALGQVYSSTEDA